MRVLLFALFVAVALCDVYMHNPRGSNNRNREEGTNTQNDQRLFDSQNNNKGGYCWGPPMTFYSGSLLQVEWTAQHACGASHPKVDCDIILQYMCAPNLRDGVTTDTIDEDTASEMVVDPKTGEETWKYGMHESAEYFAKCKARQRNVGLFIADQKIPENAKATRTRQENNNDPHGFECEEERDYYPYWHPTPWRDIAVLTSNPGRCSYYKQHSQNTEGKFECSLPEYNNQNECETNSGTWEYTKPWEIANPECVANAFSRDNHLGNSKTGYTSAYNWIIPDLKDIGDDVSDGMARCALRIRYNISSEDYYGYAPVDPAGETMVDSRFNDENSPIEQNPYVGYGKDADGYEWELRLALNTDQYARTFEDRSHMFFIKSRPSDVADTARIINLNVRGKRGNIVQAYPAVEYDFVPNQLTINSGDFIHFQWTGCDTNPKNYAGEGTPGTDRSNIVQMTDQRQNYPLTKQMAFEQVTMFDQETAFLMAHLNQYDGKICKTQDETDCCMTHEQLEAAGGNKNENVQNCMKINAPKAQYFDGGLHKLATGTYHYMSTRNNNFTNRSQKGSITVKALLPAWGIALSAIAASAFVVAAGMAGFVYYGQTHAGSAVGGMVSSMKMSV